MAKTKSIQKKSVVAKRSKQDPSDEKDSVYFFKLVFYIVIGSVWLRFQGPLQIGDIVINGFPIGLIIGLVFATQDHFKIDRKIEFAILILMAIISFFLPIAIML
jgi:ABC-type dipeptide/oligopeptide/nickel transport system permease component